MLQRKQTIYLFLAFLCVVLILFFPIFNIETIQDGEIFEGSFTAYGFQTQDGAVVGLPIYIVLIVMAMLSALGVFLYRNRARQLMVCRVNLLLHILVTVSFAVFFYMGQSLIVENTVADSTAEVSFGLDVGFFLLVASIPFLLLAIRGIKQDEQLLRSIDRIR